MDVMDAIESRRAVKHFDPAYQITDNEMERLMELVLLSPTAFNIQNWRFVLARDPALRSRLREVAWDQAQVTDASLLVILCADVKAWDRAPERYWRNAPQDVQDFIVPAIRQYYEGREWVERDEAMRSCGIAAQTLMLAARSLGYDSCPMDGFDYDAVGKLIHLPPDHVVAMFVAIGKGTKAAWPRGGQLDMGEVVLTDGFSAG